MGSEERGGSFGAAALEATRPAPRDVLPRDGDLVVSWATTGENLEFDSYEFVYDGIVILPPSGGKWEINDFITIEDTGPHSSAFSPSST